MSHINLKHYKLRAHNYTHTHTATAPGPNLHCSSITAPPPRPHHPHSFPSLRQKLGVMLDDSISSSSNNKLFPSPFYSNLENTLRPIFLSPPFTATSQLKAPSHVYYSVIFYQHLTDFTVASSTSLLILYCYFFKCKLDQVIVMHNSCSGFQMPSKQTSVSENKKARLFG